MLILVVFSLTKDSTKLIGISWKTFKFKVFKESYSFLYSLNNVLLYFLLVFFKICESV